MASNLSFAEGVMPLPNRLVDEVLPTLKDTELRVLLVVVRQTLGWREGERTFKQRDWISHGQMMRRTGRGSEAVSQAVEALVLRGLIAVEDAAGIPLATSAERRRHLGRLYYRLGDEWAVDMWKTGEKGRTGKAKTTTDIRYNIKKAGRSKGATQAGGMLTASQVVLRGNGWSRAGSPRQSRSAE